MRYKTIAILVVLVLCLSTPTLAKDKKNMAFTFRGSDWGEDMVMVMIDESFTKLKQNDDYYILDDHFLLYNVDVAGYNMTADFNFLYDALIRGAYLLDEEYEKSQEYYEAFETLLSKYKEEYGEPDTYDKEWAPIIKDKNINKNDSSNYGKYILVGELKITARWTAEDGSKIALSIYAEDREITVCALYFEPNYDEDTNGI